MNAVQKAMDDYKLACDMLKMEEAIEPTKIAKQTFDEYRLAKFAGTILFAYSENEKKANACKLRRECRKHKKIVEEPTIISDQVLPGMWIWVDKVSTW